MVVAVVVEPPRAQAQGAAHARVDRDLLPTPGWVINLRPLLAAFPAAVPFDGSGCAGRLYNRRRRLSPSDCNRGSARKCGVNVKMLFFIFRCEIDLHERRGRRI